MKSKTLLTMLLLAVCAAAQTAKTSKSAPAAVSATAPVPAIAPLLDGLQQAAQAATARLMELRIDKWKGSSADKDRWQANSQALQRNMVYALPEIINEVRRAPEQLSSNFKLYRNLDALHDVLASLAAAAAESGKGDDYRDLAEHVAALDNLRRSLAERFEVLAANKDRALGGASPTTTTAGAKPAGPKKIVVDDTQPRKKRRN
jgi:hypothetical protein